MLSLQVTYIKSLFSINSHFITNKMIWKGQVLKACISYNFFLSLWTMPIHFRVRKTNGMAVLCTPSPPSTLPCHVPGWQPGGLVHSPPQRAFPLVQQQNHMTPAETDGGQMSKVPTH